MQEWQEYKSLMAEVEEFQKELVAIGGRKSTNHAATPKSQSASPANYVLSESEGQDLGVGDVPEVQENLNSDIWSEDLVLMPDIAKRLIRIANDFFNNLGMPTDIIDITLTGSMANFNWTTKSDIDVHILIDFPAVNEDTELVHNYVIQAKSNWNRNHEITIKGHEVELYIQDVNEPHHSTAVYSIMNNEWVIRPVRVEFEVSEDAVRQKADSFEHNIEMIGTVFDQGRFEESYGDSERMIQKLKRYRQSGLEKGGEYSVENLVFKSLRNGEIIDKLHDIKKRSYDSMFSMIEQ